MKKGLIALLITLLFVPAVCSAETPAYMYARTSDNLVLTMQLRMAPTDALNAFVVSNVGSARANQEIDSLTLYRDDGDGVFEGFGRDSEIAKATLYFDRTWYFSGLKENIANATQSFFVTAAMKSNGENNRTIEFAVDAAKDVNADGVFQVGDSGIFFRSGKVWPETQMKSLVFSRYRNQSTDIFSPLVVPQNLVNNMNIVTSSYLIKGVARDQGGSSVSRVEVCVNSVCSPATNTGTDYSTWEYDWTGLTPATYSLTVRATDSANNSTETASVLIKVAPANSPLGAGGQPAAPTDRYIKTASTSAVYHLDPHNIRHAYPTAAVWQSRFGTSFAAVETVSDAEMASYPLGANEQFMEGSLIKIPSIAKVYKVEAGKLRWVQTEAAASRLFGADWNRQVYDLPEGFWGDYERGDALSES